MDKNELKLLKQILLNTPDYLFWKDINSIYRGCNFNFSRIAGFKSPDEIIGKSDEQMQWGAYTGSIYKNEDSAILATGQSLLAKEVPMLINGVDGQQQRLLSVSKVPLYDDGGNINGVLGIFVDITAQKEAEKREKAALVESALAYSKIAEAETEMRQAITVLAGSIAHDLRTPLASIRMTGSSINDYLPQLIEGYRLACEANLIPTAARLYPRQLKGLQEVGNNFDVTVTEMNEFIDITLKTMSGLVTGGLTEEDLLPCDLNWCVNSLLKKYPMTTEQQNLIQWDRKSFLFLGNTVLFFRVIDNILKNSLYQIKKNNRGQIFMAAENSGDKNIFRIKDTAGGTAPHIVKQLFDGYKTTKKEGTGVGLAFCKLTMRSFGGDITCHSIEGDYMEFVLSFPVVKT